MPRPSKKATQAKTQREAGKPSFTKIPEDDEGSEWEEDEDELDDSDDETSQGRLRKLYSLFLPEHLQSVTGDRQVWQ